VPIELGDRREDALLLEKPHEHITTGRLRGSGCYDASRSPSARNAWQLVQPLQGPVGVLRWAAGALRYPVWAVCELLL